jgi:long-chain acyl-CoA synthetase
MTKWGNAHDRRRGIAAFAKDAGEPGHHHGVPVRRPVSTASRAPGDPGKPALILGDTTRTFEQLGAQAARVHGALTAAGLEAGDRVAVMLPNGIDFFEVSLGAAAAGCPVVPINWHLKAEELAWVVGDGGARLLVAHADWADAARAALARVGDCRLLLVGGDGPDSYEAAVAAARPAPVAVGWDAPTYLYFTSGTTGRPRAVDRDTPAPGAAVLRGLAAMWGLREDDVYLACSPLYHAANGYAYATLFQGGTVVVLPRWDADAWLSAVEQYRVTTCFMVPAYFVRLLEVPADRWAQVDLSSLRLILHAAAPCPIPVKSGILDRLPDIDVWEFYGATEGGATRISAPEWRARPGSVGRPWPGVEIRVLDERNGRLEPGKTGRIFIRPPGGQRFRYHNDPGKTDEAWVGDAFTVGDVGHLDGDGFLYITDRASDMVIRGGVNIYPAEVEAVLHLHPAVVDCAVFGVPDERLGEELQALVEVRRPVSADELRDHCQAHLADFKVPRRIEAVDALPRDPLGKVQKRRLRQEHWAGHRTAVS